MRVLDLCAAPGGKSTQLATYLGDSGLLVSNEINTQRSRILSQNIERMGIKNAIVTNEDSFVLASHFPGFLMLYRWMHLARERECFESCLRQ